MKTSILPTMALAFKGGLVGRLQSTCIIEWEARPTQWPDPGHNESGRMAWRYRWQDPLSEEHWRIHVYSDLHLTASDRRDAGMINDIKDFISPRGQRIADI